MVKSLTWSSDAKWAQIDPFLPSGRCGARRVDDRRVILGIVHMLWMVRVGATARPSRHLRRRSRTADRLQRSLGSDDDRFQLHPSGVDSHR